jgi:hypothetical protein
VVNGKYLHALYFASGFALALFFVLCPFLQPTLTLRLLRLVFPPCFLLASRAAQTKGQKSGCALNGSRTRRRQQRWRRLWQRRVGPSQALGYNRGVALDFVRFYRGGQASDCARACEEYLTQTQLRRALPKGYEFFELKILKRKSKFCPCAALNYHGAPRPIPAAPLDVFRRCLIVVPRSLPRRRNAVAAG